MLTASDPSPTSQTGSPGLPAEGTLAEVVARLDHDRRLDPARLAKWSGAIRTLCRVLKRPPEAIPAVPSDIDRLLREIPRAAHGRSKKTIDNMRSLTKAALLYVMRAGGSPPPGTPFSSEWVRLSDALVDQRLKHGLSRLMRVASWQGVGPTEMNDEALRSIIETVRQVNWGRDAVRFHRQVVALWNEAAASVPGWPRIRLTPAVPSSRPSHLPLTAFRASFQHDVDEYLAWAAGTDRFASDAPSRPLKPSTLHLRREQLRIAASTLARELGSPDQIVSLATLVDPANVKRILTAMFKPGKPQPTDYMRGMAITLKALAEHWVKVSPADLAELKRLQSKLGSTKAGLKDKNRLLVRQLDDPRILEQLLALPDTLRKQVQTRRLSPSRRLQKIQIALAIDLLLAAPIRLANLAGLRLQEQVVWPTGRDGTVFLIFRDDEVKNEQPLEYELPAHVRASLHDYLDRYRGPIVPRDERALFVRGDGSPLNAAVLRDGITKATQRELGIKITPHQFRHLAAKIVLDTHPGAIVMVKELLGHKSFKTTANAYAGLRTREAAREYDKLLTAHRPVSGGR